MGFAISSVGIEILQNTELNLIWFNKSTSNAPIYSEYVPGVANSWTESANGLVYTFSLYNNVYFSNGDPFNAYVVWYNVYRDMIMNQPTDAELFTYFNDSGVTAQDLNALNNSQNAPTGAELALAQNPDNAITVLNSTAVQFHLTTNFLAFLETVAGEPWYFADPYLVSQNGGVVANQSNAWMSTYGANVGDGPYVVSSYVPNQYAVLEANPHYWAQNMTSNFYLQPAVIPQVMINFKPDELTRILDLENDRAQGGIVAFNDVNKTLQADSQLTVPNIGPSGGIEFISLNTEYGPLNNTLVREAVMAALNLTEIQQIAFAGYATPFVGPLPSGDPDYNNSILPPAYNVTLAEELLSEAGYPGGKGLPTLTMDYSQSSYIALVAQIMASELSQVGITLTSQAISLVAFPSIDGLSPSKAPDFTYNGWFYWPDFTGYEYLVDSSFGVYLDFYNQTVHNLIIESNSQTNATLRAQEISQITYDVKQQAAIIWLSQDTDIFNTGIVNGPAIVNVCVSGFYYNSQLGGLEFNVLHYACSPSS